MLLSGLEFPAEELAFGHTKIFIRSPRTVSPAPGGGGDPARGSQAVEGQGLTQSTYQPWGSPCRAGGPKSILEAPG